MDMQQLTLAEIGRALASRAFSAEELAKTLLTRIKTLDPQLNSFITLTAVPEPGTFGLLGLALAGLAFLRFRKRRQEAAAAVDGAGE